jgi:hypothetical protein
MRSCWRAIASGFVAVDARGGEGCLCLPIPRNCFNANASRSALIGIAVTPHWDLLPDYNVVAKVASFFANIVVCMLTWCMDDGKMVASNSDEEDECMGTNYYWLNQGQSDDPTIHIGKRSAAGCYCWDCGTTLCARGTEGVHYDRHDWHHTCPICGSEPSKEPVAKKEGVRGCSSFTWTMMKHLVKVKEYAEKCPENIVIENQYGDKFTAKEFLAMLEWCPIQYQYAGHFS